MVRIPAGVTASVIFLGHQQRAMQLDPVLFQPALRAFAVEDMTVIGAGLVEAADDGVIPIVGNEHREFSGSVMADSR